MHLTCGRSLVPSVYEAGGWLTVKRVSGHEEILPCRKHTTGIYGCRTMSCLIILERIPDRRLTLSDTTMRLGSLRTDGEICYVPHCLEEESTLG